MAGQIAGRIAPGIQKRLPAGSANPAQIEAPSADPSQAVDCPGVHPGCPSPPVPDQLPGKLVVTNTTTPEDMEMFRSAGVSHLVTTTPVYDGRSFGTNMLEAALLAASGHTQAIDYANPGNYYQEMSDLIRQVGLKPQVQKL